MDASRQKKEQWTTAAVAILSGDTDVLKQVPETERKRVESIAQSIRSHARTRCRDCSGRAVIKLNGKYEMCPCAKKRIQVAQRDNKEFHGGTESKVIIASYLERADNGKILCVRIDGKWALPSAVVREGEELEVAQARGLLETAGVETQDRYHKYSAKTVQDYRMARIHVYQVLPTQTPWKRAPQWMPRGEFLQLTPLARFYETMFASKAFTAG